MARHRMCSSFIYFLGWVGEGLHKAHADINLHFENTCLFSIYMLEGLIQMLCTLGYISSLFKY